MPQIIDNLDNTSHIECPNCGKCGIEYLYTGDERTRIGFLQIWCSECLKGVHISRVETLRNAKFVSFDADLGDIVPKYDTM